MKILMFGKGEFSQIIRDIYEINAEDITGYVESNPADDSYQGKPLYSISNIAHVDYDYIYIANAFYVTLKEALNYAEKQKIVICSIDVAMDYYKDNKKMDIRCMFPSVLTNFFQDYEPDCIRKFLLGKEKHKFLVATDYSRLGTLKLLAKEINSNNVAGDVAELGVYKGDFAKYINKYFPDRTLHLFDTFEGFVKKDINKQEESGLNLLNDLGSKGLDTSVDLVLNKMANRSRCSVYKGFFPNTIPHGDLHFSFVSLDCDLYQPMLEGLRYFYPRVRGGVSNVTRLQ